MPKKSKKSKKSEPEPEKVEEEAPVEDEEEVEEVKAKKEKKKKKKKKQQVSEDEEEDEEMTAKKKKKKKKSKKKESSEEEPEEEPVEEPVEEPEEEPEEEPVQKKSKKKKRKKSVKFEVEEDEEEEEKENAPAEEVKDEASKSSSNSISALASGSKSKGLPEQRLEDLDPTTLTPLTKIVMNRQATINIGTIGHVAHGKSTVVKAISSVHTVRFKTELIRNITIKLGYANAKIYKCLEPTCPAPDCYRSYGSATEVSPKCERPGCPGYMDLQRHVSFVDCPGHDILMATMLNGAAVMDAALLLVAGNEPCPQPQTSEHLAAVEIMKLKNIIILQNKIDLVKEKEAASQYEQILNFIRGTVADGAPIIPISAQLKYNIDLIAEHICRLPVPVRDFTSSPQMIVIRSFDVNKPGEEVDNLKGGVAGGSILQGVITVGQEIEIRPGIIEKNAQGKVQCSPIFSTVLSLYAESNDLKFAVPGGLIGVGTKIDPTLTRADRLVGQVLGSVGNLPKIFTELEISFFLLRRLLGVKADGDKKGEKVKKLAKGEFLLVNIGSTSSGARVLVVKGDLARVQLMQPVCSKEGEKLALSRRVDKHFRLIGWGKILVGVTISEDK